MILSLCIPTYNRSSCIGEQLHRLNALDPKLLDKIEIIISDNCSSDNTMEIIESYNKKLDFVYNRNNTNIGADGNFLKCLELSSAKYVWILGDDDYIVEEGLVKLTDFLQKSDYGLVHINTFNKQYSTPFVQYTNYDKFINDIGIYITFISSNIVNRKYVEKIDLHKHIGSYFVLVPLYLSCAHYGETNAIVCDKILEEPAASETNGGYNVFEVFVTNYLKIFKEFNDMKMISDKLYRKEVQMSKEFVIPFYYRLVIRKQKSNFKIDNAKNILVEHFGVLGTYSAISKFLLKSMLRKIIRR